MEFTSLHLQIITGHITTANIFIDSENKVARISALENFVLGVNSFYRPFLVQNVKVTSLELIDVSDRDTFSK